jgi:hypothetical protein
MIVTEEQAKSKWCPMARERRNPLINTAINRSLEGYGESLCIASGCMMWVWDTDWDTDEESKGHCGLAGGLT